MENVTMRGFVSNGSELVALEGEGTIIGSTIVIKFITEMKREKLDPLEEEEVISLVLRKALPTVK